MTQVGFACHILNPDRSKAATTDFRSATVTYVSQLPLRERRAYIVAIVEHNLNALEACMRWLAQRPHGQRMFRITSGLTPLYTHECVQRIYRDPAFEQAIADRLARIGANYRQCGIRLSFHPGQFCVLNSAKESTRVDSIAEFEHHARQAEWLGYRGGNHNNASLSGAYDGFAINIHGGAWHGERGLSSLETNLTSWDWSWARLSAGARRLITLENDEFAWSTRSIVALCQRHGIRPVLDVHHHWINTGMWLSPGSGSAQATHQLWPLAGPKLHVSLPRPQLTTSRMRDAPLAAGHNWWRRLEQLDPDKRAALRAHSNYIWHPGMVPYLHEWQRAGWHLLVETKLKNLASENLAEALQYYGRTYT